MDKKELLLHINRCEELHERRKLKRSAYIVLFYTAVLLGICYLQGRFDKKNIWHIAVEVVVCIIISCVSVLFNSIIYHQLFKLNQDEEATIEYLRKRLREKEQGDNNT